MLRASPSLGAVRGISAEPVALVKALADRRQKLREFWLKGDVHLSDAEFLGLEDIQSSLLPGECVVDILWTRYRVVSFVIGATVLESHTVTLEDAQAMLEVNTAGTAENRLAVVAGLTGDLSKRVLACSRVFVVPDGPLTSFNFSLQVGLGPEIALLPGAALLPILRSRKSSSASGALLIGSDPRHDLPGVPYELGRLKRILDSTPTVVLVSGIASDSDPLERLGWEAELGIIHFACHGWLADSKEESGLLMERDGRAFLLAVEDIERYVHAKADLLVLSACEVGQPTDQGESIDFLGLPRAFFVCCRAGCIVAATTRVDDALSALVMSAFYRRLVQGMPVGRALREAEAEVANLTRSELYVLAEAGLPVSAPQMARGGTGDVHPYRRALQQSPYVIYGDPALVVELRRPA
jgi:hypothetical protein